MSGFRPSEKQTSGCSYDCKSCGKRAKPGCQICKGQPTHFGVKLKTTIGVYPGDARCNCNICHVDEWMKCIGSCTIDHVEYIRIYAYSKFQGIFKVNTLYHDMTQDERDFNEIVSRINGKHVDEIKRRDWDNE